MRADTLGEYLELEGKIASVETLRQVVGCQVDDISYCLQPSHAAAAEEGPVGAVGGEDEDTEDNSGEVARAEVGKMSVQISFFGI